MVSTSILSQDFDEETRLLVRSRMPYVAGAFIAIAVVSWLFEHQSDPRRDLYAGLVFALQAAVLLVATWACRRSRWQAWVVGIASGAVAAIPLLAATYHLLVGIEVELLVVGMVFLLAATTVIMPWGLRGQLPVTVSAALACGGGLALGLPAPLAPGLALTGLIAVGALSVIGAHLLANNRAYLLNTNRELHAAYDAVRQAGLTKNEFIANLSHELRTPLNTIVGYTDLLLDDDFGTLGAEMRAPIERISRSADNLRALINDLIDLALIESGRLKVEMKDVPLAPLFDELAAQTEPMLRDRPIRFYYAEPDSLAVHADVVRLRQILTNLVGNAAKYTPQGKIELRAARRNGGVDIEVRDTGPGVPQDEIQSIFTPFYRGSSRGSTGGVGLGLSMSARLAEMMGGNISVDSELGKGSCFTLHLSSSAAEPAVTPPR
jgi:signal transduction histidine kinase